MAFWTYMLHCRGGVFYTGHTDDLERRIAQHQSGSLPGFTWSRLPAELVWSQDFPTRLDALEAERRIKGWSRAKKLALIRGDWDRRSSLAKGKSGPSTGSGRTDVVVSCGIVEALIQHARLAAPHEACGILLGYDTSITQARPCANIHPEPLRHFEIDAQALIDAHRAARNHGPQVLGYYHSHPQGPPHPSATDQAMAHHDGSIWAIIAEDAVTLWRDVEQAFEALSYRVIDQ